MQLHEKDLFIAKLKDEVEKVKSCKAVMIRQIEDLAKDMRV